MSILGQDGMGTPGATPYSSTVGANVANGGMAPLKKDASGNVTSLVDGAGNSFPLVNVDNSMVLFGDSFMYSHGTYAGNTHWIDKGYWVWANAKAKGAINIIKNFGISGNATTDLLLRMEADLRPYPARFLAINGGVNDNIVTATNPIALTAAQTIANMELIVSRAIGMGYIVLLHTPGPYAVDAAAAARTAKIARGYRDMARRLRGVVLVDIFAAMISPSDTSGAMVAGYSNDAIKLHPNAAGARRIGEFACYPAILPLLLQNDQRPVSQADTVSNFGADASQVMLNPLLTATGGTVSGAGASGAAPADYTCRTATGTVTSVWSLVARSDGFGNDINCVVSGAADSSGVEFLSSSNHASVADGDVITEATISMSMSGFAAGNITKISLYVSFTDGAGGHTYSALQTSTTTIDSADITDFVFRTLPFTITGTCTDLRIRGRVDFASGAAGTLKFGRLGMNKRPV